MPEFELDETYKTFEMAGVKRSQPLPSWVKLLLGCGLSCAVVIVGLVMLVGFVYSWFMRPGKQVPTDWVLGDGSAGALRLDDLGADSGVKAFSELLVREIASRPSGEFPLPAFMEQIDEGFAAVLPSEATLALEAGGDELEFVMAVNFRSLLRPARRVLRANARESLAERGAKPREHRGIGLLEFRAAAAAFVDGTLLLSTTAAPLESGLDRVLDRKQGGEKASLPGGLQELLAELERLREPFDLYGVLRRRGIDVAGALGRELGWEDWRIQRDLAWFPTDYERVELGLDVVSADEAKLHARIDCASAGSAEVSREKLAEVLWSLAEHLDARKMRLKYDLALQGPSLVAELTWTGLEQAAGSVADLVLSTEDG